MINTSLTARRPLNRIIMRDYALLYRDRLKFAKKYAQYNESVMTRWMLLAGQSVQLACIARDQKG